MGFIVYYHVQRYLCTDVRAPALASCSFFFQSSYSGIKGAVGGAVSVVVVALWNSSVVSLSIVVGSGVTGRVVVAGGWLEELASLLMMVGGPDSKRARRSS